MAELGRARPVIVATIATILTANIAILSTEHVQAELRDTPPSTAARAIAASRDVVVFGKSDTRVGRPTMFAVRPNGDALTPWSRGTVASPRPTRSHDGSRVAVIRSVPDGDELWVTSPTGGDPRRLVRAVARDASFCGRAARVTTQLGQPTWSPDDRYVAFLSNANHLNAFGASFDILVVSADGAERATAYRTPAAECDRVPGANGIVRRVEFVSLFGWAKSANMAA